MDKGAIFSDQLGAMLCEKPTVYRPSIFMPHFGMRLRSLPSENSARFAHVMPTSGRSSETKLLRRATLPL